MDEQWHEDTLHTKQAYLLRVMSSIIIWTVIKTVHHVWILLTIQKQSQKNAVTAHMHTICAVGITHHNVQGIRNDDQSLSLVIPFVSLLFLLFLVP